MKKMLKTIMRSFVLLLVITIVISNARPTSFQMRPNYINREIKSKKDFTCSSICDGDYLLCYSVIRNLYEHFICLKVRSSCKRRCPIEAELHNQLNRIWNKK